jgi:hypothetical protein
MPFVPVSMDFVFGVVFYLYTSGTDILFLLVEGIEPGQRLLEMLGRSSQQCNPHWLNFMRYCKLTCGRGKKEMPYFSAAV